ncbi:MAG: carboxy terminal-processing peptidase, partial [Steroidobacteraceae bacterium]
MSKPLRRPSGWIAASALTILALALVGSARAPASASILPPGAIAPTEAQRATARKIGRILEEAHYSRMPIDDRMSELVYQRYLDFLDGQRSYFLASDIAEFSAYRLQFDDMIRTGDIEPAYLIFNRFQQRNRERMEGAIALLKTEPDWSVNESFGFERAKAPWPGTPAEMNDLWRKRVKNDALSLMLTGKQWPEAAALLRKRYQRVLKRVN